MTPLQHKQALRRAARARAAAFCSQSGGSAAAAASARACAAVSALRAFREAALVLAYMPLATEADCTALITTAAQNGARVALPRVESAGGNMEYYLLATDADTGTAHADDSTGNASTARAAEADAGSAGTPAAGDASATSVAPADAGACGITADDGTAVAAKAVAGVSAPVGSAGARPASSALAPLPAWLKTQTEAGAYGIREPRRSLELFVPEAFGGSIFVIVPGVAFTADGARLGHGKGFYDRYLARLARAGREKATSARPFLTCCGFCFDCQLFPSLPTDAHDVRMDCIATESGAWLTAR